ncbi:VOC family protein [Dyadobacter frigoris]|uniref:VOC family protein n=1 Tax=Dyadobacter frigoris TaxID=2576211 RepID=A0A4U6CPB3_9BACT|nr:VOC family protein [Dyadobacter frigoris]TKT86279.1 VOC family protein [Dyadobacter frigoris]GLU56878.1 VOC family protein [Dyadobacter frigoris]
MAQINAYLTFAGKCREAMTFYRECLGGELEFIVIEDSPMAGHFPAELQKSILHSSLAKGNLILLATDMTGPDGMVKGNNVSLSVTCDSEAEMNDYFSALSAGGKVTYPLEDFFAGRMGSLVDKFGMYWSVYYDKKSGQ